MYTNEKFSLRHEVISLRDGIFHQDEGGGEGLRQWNLKFVAVRSLEGGKVEEVGEVLSSSRIC
jgi:hypothetical protein